MLDLIIRGGLVIDPATETERIASVAIEGNRISGIFEVGEEPAATQIIDAAGCIVTPGLIDSHLHPLLKQIPLFACAMMCGALLSWILNKAGMGHYIDRATINRIAGVALDFLVCAAIATLSLKVFALYMVPMIVTIVSVIFANILCNFYFAWKMFDDDWFERAMGSYGLESGVLATGLMLLRVVDPKFETQGQESAAASAALCYPWSLPYIMFGPMLAFHVSPMVLFAGSAALWIFFYIVARKFFWHPERNFSEIL